MKHPGGGSSTGTAVDEADSERTTQLKGMIEYNEGL